MKVHILLYNWYNGDTEVIGAYSSEERANEAQAKDIYINNTLSIDYIINEVEVQ